MYEHLNLAVFSTPASMAVTMFRGLRADGLRLKSFAVGSARSFLSRDGLWRRRHWLSLVFVVFSLLMVRAVLGLRTRREPVLIAGTVNELMNLSPKGFVNIGLAALQLAKERYPGLDVAATDRRIDGMAIRISRLAGELRGKVERPETTAMNRILFEEEGFRYDMDSLKHNRLDPGYLYTGVRSFVNAPVVYPSPASTKIKKDKIDAGVLTEQGAANSEASRLMSIVKI